MTRALALLILPFAANAAGNAAGNAPGAHLWPEEPAYVVWIDAQELFPLWRRCGPDTPCSVPYDRDPDPAPVPLPSSGLMLAAACGLLWKRRSA